MPPRYLVKRRGNTSAFERRRLPVMRADGHSTSDSKE
ncbi:Uncharacterised protein [Mycobacteroides abscessus subsp. abscessus]|nr:Uncharacterised protein [Mycobacteroides abscessus subsp. abscessus]